MSPVDIACFYVALLLFRYGEFGFFFHCITEKSKINNSGTNAFREGKLNGFSDFLPFAAKISSLKCICGINLQFIP